MRVLIAIALMAAWTSQLHAQCGNRQFFVISRSAVRSSTAATTVRTGLSDVACSGGVCVAPLAFANGSRSGQVVIIPQSIAFFAMSNPRTIQFETREFVQIPGSDFIVTTGSGDLEVVQPVTSRFVTSPNSDVTIVTDSFNNNIILPQPGRSILLFVR